ncbi:uncharacterized protein [Physcomitrium patens]|uniref:Uncharacterized protein n=1 Tax=Physcomitrium patens TaxID=3218 RepID=A0A2K1IW17_PHYPA|nr:suppressor protein SRP40-like isoform X1 [Physcomitrium patens]XP_024357266.1 suppressor protein SRP40-like isoform X1 [Physcomitrium patens]PNR33473.1 hypothetical protein PHYPA_025417 [Physcomitrium patens]|eukprot:XP_024357265.1 suppressor protein SRP40-like isoform X1 [Physcomitrella patens]
MAQPLQGYGFDQLASPPGEEHTDLTSEDQCRDHVDHHGHKRSSIFGKFKDKTKKAGSKIKHNVGKSWSNGDGSTIVVDDDDQGEEEGDATSSTSSSNAGLSSPTSPAIKVTPYSGPTSVPRVFGTYPSPKPRKSEDTDKRDTDSASVMSRLSISETQNIAPETKSTTHEPSAAEELSGVSPNSGRRGYDAAALTQGTDTENSEVNDQSKKAISWGPHSATDAAFETRDTAQSKVKDVSNANGDAAMDTEQESGAALGSKDAAKDTFVTNLQSEEPSVVDKAKDSISNGTADDYAASGNDATAETLCTEPRSSPGPHSSTSTGTAPAYEMRDAARSKADDLNNATGDSETYTDKATNAAAIATKDTVTDKWGMNQPSEGHSEVDKTKDTEGSAVDTTRDSITSETDTTKSSTNNADTTRKEETADNTLAPIDTSKGCANHVNVIGADVPVSKEEDKALSEKITEALGWLVTSSTIPATGHSESSPGILGKFTGFLAPKS